MNFFRPVCLAVSFSLVLAASARAGEPAKEKDGLPLVFHEDFSDGEKALEKFKFDDPAAWKIAKDKVGDSERDVLSLHQQSKYKPPVRTPFDRGIVKDLWVGPFVMEVKLKSTVKDYNHRDLCLFFGNADDSHQYYVHLGKAPDPHCGNIFLVDAADRVALAPVPKKGIDWTDQYHTATVSRGEDGTIEVFFDGKSWLKVTDKTFPVGRVGVGSFDDLGNFAEITVWGKKAEKPAEADANKPIAPAKKPEPKKEAAK